MAINNTYNPVQANEEINQLTHRIIGCAMQVHRTMGNGFHLPESVSYRIYVSKHRLRSRAENGLILQRAAYWYQKSRFLCRRQGNA